MLKFCANINWLFREHDFADRFAAARDAGLTAVEFHHPEGCEPATVIRKAAEAGVKIALFNAWPGDLMEGGCGLSGIPGREDQFRAAVEQVVAFGGAIGGRAVVQIGQSRIPEGVTRSDCLDVYVSNMQFASAELAKVACRVMIEPMNTVEFPNVLISNVDSAFEVIDRAGVDNLGLQFDCYHEAMIGGDVEATIRRIHERIDHLQFSDAPGRGEPGTGKLDIQQIFQTLDEVGYDKWVAAEYQPTGSSDASLQWLREYRKLTP
jgi:hydroxypyruvate isomerase